MTHISNHNANGNANILGSVRRHHKHERAKDPSLPALVPGGGKIVANGVLRAVMPTVGGSVVVYSVTPHIEWRSHREAPLARLRPLNGGATPAATPGDRVKTLLDAALGEIIAIERRARDAQPETPTRIAAE